MAKKKPRVPVLMTWAEVCIELNCSRSTLKRMIDKKLISAPKPITGFRQKYFDQAVFVREARRALGWSTADSCGDDLDAMTVAQACADLNVGRTTVMRMVAKELLSPPKRIGNFRQAYLQGRVFLKESREAMG